MSGRTGEMYYFSAELIFPYFITKEREREGEANTGKFISRLLLNFIHFIVTGKHVFF